jgi:hypothetical protein
MDRGLLSYLLKKSKEKNPLKKTWIGQRKGITIKQIKNKS